MVLTNGQLSALQLFAPGRIFFSLEIQEPESRL